MRAEVIGVEWIRKDWIGLLELTGVELNRVDLSRREETGEDWFVGLDGSRGE
jgi:hypothetical protein